MLMGGAAVLAGCSTDKNYDFDNVDLTLGIGGGQLSLPGNNSSADIPLDDLLDLEGSDLVSTNDAGDYMISKIPDAVKPVTVSVDPVSLQQAQNVGGQVTVGIPQELMSQAGQTLDVSSMNIKAEGVVAAIDYSFSIPEAIKSLEHVNVGSYADGVPLTLTLTFPKAIKRFEYIRIDLPLMLEMTYPTLQPGSFNVYSNRLLLNNYRPSDVLNLRFQVTGINIGTIDGQNLAELVNGMFQLKGSMNIDAKVAELTVPDTNTLVLGGTADFKNVTISGAKGIFDPEINLADAGTVTISSVPSFLTDEEVIVDLDNPQIWLTVRSTMPLGGVIEAELTSDTYEGAIPLRGDKAIRVKASPDGSRETETKVLICHKNPGVSTTDYQVIEEGSLTKLVNKLREGMTIKFAVTKAKAAQETAEIVLGRSYSLAPSYRFEAPLAFGPGARIVYNKSFDGWHEDIEELSLANGTYVVMKGTAINRIPTNLELDAYAIGTDGQKLEDVKIELLKNKVGGAKNGSVESEVEIKASGNIRLLDGMTMRLKGTSNSELQGITLNKTSQTLTMKNVGVTLFGTIIYDAN